MSDFNDIGISRQLDRPRIRKLLSIGLFASLLHLAGDILLGSGVQDETREGLARMLSAYAGASDGRIFAAALLGLFGTALELLALFGVYRLMAGASPAHAHRYRSGILGCMLFYSCGFHVPMCAMAFLTKHGLTDELLFQFARYFFVVPMALFFGFFLVLCIAQLGAFSRGFTPYPRWCRVFSPLFAVVPALLGLVLGNCPAGNALFCAWLAIGFVWTFGGLLLCMKKAGFPD